MDKFFELIAEETEFETRSEDQVHQLPSHCPKSPIGAFLIRK